MIDVIKVLKKPLLGGFLKSNKSFRFASHVSIHKSVIHRQPVSVPCKYAVVFQSSKVIAYHCFTVFCVRLCHVSGSYVPFSGKECRQYQTVKIFFAAPFQMVFRADHCPFFLLFHSFNHVYVTSLPAPTLV